MKKLIAMVTILFVTTAVFAQGNIPIGLQHMNDQTHNDLSKYNDNLHDKISNDFLFAKKSMETIWVRDSTFFYGSSQ